MSASGFACRGRRAVSKASSFLFGLWAATGVGCAPLGGVLGDAHTAQPQPELIADLAYVAGGHPAQKLDLLLPAERSSEPLPTVVYLHGGGWALGDKQQALTRMRGVVEEGYAVVSVNYRLSGDAPWPAQLDDTKAALRWVRANAAAYGLDAERVALLGPSAGGHLAAMLALTADDPAFEGALGEHRSASTRVSAAVILCGPTNLATLSDPPAWMESERLENSPQTLVGRLLGGALKDRRDVAVAASPVTHASADDPPMLLVYGAEDPLVPLSQGVELNARLQALGVSSTLIRVDGAGHTDLVTPEVYERIGAFLNELLRR